MPRKKQLKSFEIVSIAVFLLGGDSRFIDTEDVAVKANGLAPGLFTWKKYKDQISFDHIRRKLTEATLSKGGRYLVGSVRRGWQLTPEGMEFARKEVSRFDQNEMKGVRLDGKDQMRLRLEKERLRLSRAFGKFCSGRMADITADDARSFFRVDEYVPIQIREGKILRIENNFSEDPEFSDLIRYLKKLLVEEMS